MSNTMILIILWGIAVVEEMLFWAFWLCLMGFYHLDQFSFCLFRLTPSLSYGFLELLRRERRIVYIEESDELPEVLCCLMF